MFKCLGRAEASRNWGCNHLVDRSPVGIDDYNKLDHLQQQLDLLLSQWLEQAGAVDPLFTLAIMDMSYLARFKIPTMASYDGSTDTDEHMENCHMHMLIQNANEATLFKSFCLTLTNTAR